LPSLPLAFAVIPRMIIDQIKRKDLFTRDTILQRLVCLGELRSPNFDHACSNDRCYPRNYLQLGIPRSQSLEESIFVCREARVHKCNELCAGQLIGTKKNNYVCPISRKMKGDGRLEIEVSGFAQSANDRMSGRENTMSVPFEINRDAVRASEALDVYYSKYAITTHPQKRNDDDESPLSQTDALNKSKVGAIITTKSRARMEKMITPKALSVPGILELFAGISPIEIAWPGVPVFLHIPLCSEYIKQHLFRKSPDGKTIPTTTLLLAANMLRVSSCADGYASWIKDVRFRNGQLKTKDQTVAWKKDLTRYNKKIIPILRRIEDVFEFCFPSLSRWKKNIPALRSRQCQKYSDMINNLRDCAANGIMPNMTSIALGLDLSDNSCTETLIDFPTRPMYLRYLRIVYTMLQYCLSVYPIAKKQKSEVAFKSVTVDKLVLGIIGILQSGFRIDSGTVVIPKDLYLNRRGIIPEGNKMTQLSQNSRKIQTHGIVIVIRCLEYGLKTMSPPQLWNEISGQTYTVFEARGGKLMPESLKNIQI
jgi:hypothetical protein